MGRPGPVTWAGKDARGSGLLKLHPGRVGRNRGACVRCDSSLAAEGVYGCLCSVLYSIEGYRRCVQPTAMRRFRR